MHKGGILPGPVHRDSAHPSAPTIASGAVPRVNSLQAERGEWRACESLPQIHTSRYLKNVGGPGELDANEGGEDD